MRQTLSKREILASQLDIRRVVEAGAARTGRLVSVRARPAARRRVGFLVTRRMRNAVERNLVKRRLREIYRRHKDAFAPDREYALIGRPGCARCRFAVLEQEVIGLVGRETRTDAMRQEGTGDR